MHTHNKPTLAIVLTCSPNKLTSLPRILWVFIKTRAKAAATTPTAAPAEVAVSKRSYKANRSSLTAADRTMQQVEPV